MFCLSLGSQAKSCFLSIHVALFSHCKLLWEIHILFFNTAETAFMQTAAPCKQQNRQHLWSGCRWTPRSVCWGESGRCSSDSSVLCYWSVSVAFPPLCLVTDPLVTVRYLWNLAISPWSSGAGNKGGHTWGTYFLSAVLFSASSKRPPLDGSAAQPFLARALLGSRLNVAAVYCTLLSVSMCTILLQTVFLPLNFWSFYVKLRII